MTDVKVPPLGESITEATIARWAKHEGDAVAVGETIVELETDKINVEVPAQKAGVLVKLARREGEIVGVGDILGTIDETARADDKKAAAAATAAPPSPPPAASPPSSLAPSPSLPVQRVAPSAARLAEEQKISLEGVKGTGRGGMVSKADVIEQTRDQRPETRETAPAATPAPASSGLSSLVSGLAPRERREPMSTRRKRIAENLLASHLGTAHLTTFNEIDMTAVMAIRERHKERVEKEHGVRLSFMPFFAKAAVLALKAHPVVNAQVDGDAIIYKDYVHLGIAVASDQGLVVPAVKNAHAMSVLELGSAIAALAKKARDIKLTMDDLTGGTFTITNGGVFGSLISTPIINFPQVGILGLHKIQERPVVVNGAVVARPMMYIALSYDHRIIDGQQAVLFLIKIKELMEDPASMLLE